MKNRKRSAAPVKLILLWLGLVCLTAGAWGGTEYYRHVVFDNSIRPDA